MAAPVTTPPAATAPVEQGQEQGFGLLWQGDTPSMTVLKRGRRGPGSAPLVRSFGTTRTCAVDGCDTQLSRYNPASCCYRHQGWDLEPVTRPRRPVAPLPLAPATTDDHPFD
jgi:hypothetical protein